MFDIYGVPPHCDKEQKIACRNTQEAAKEYCYNLASFGYHNLRVVNVDTPPQPQPAPAQDQK